jgi:hypothetical protein
MHPATVLAVLFAGASVVGLVVGDQQHSGNLLRVLDGEPVVAREGIIDRPERLGRVNAVTPQRHTHFVDRAGVHCGVGIFVGAREVEVDPVTFGGHLHVRLKAPVNDRGGDAERLPIRVHDLHTDTRHGRG